VSRVVVGGLGAVSPAGWSLDSSERAVAGGRPLPIQEIERPGWDRPGHVRRVPAPEPRPEFLGQARMRRSAPITQFAVGAALEALGDDVKAVRAGTLRLGIVVCTMTGCVTYSRRFYDETLRDPATASPLLFPETVFNAPASHLAALLGATGLNYSIVGDHGTFLVGLALGAEWLVDRVVDGCVVVGAEELDWVMADAQRLFSRRAVLSEGAGAVYLKPGEEGDPGVELTAITEPQLFVRHASRRAFASRMRQQLIDSGPIDLLCDGLLGIPALDAIEADLWSDWGGGRISPRRILGEGFVASAAWQCVSAIRAMQRDGHCAVGVSVVGCNQQAVGARFQGSS
jgi:hypothetical protein